jgi:hypothetical protein
MSSNVWISLRRPRRSSPGDNAPEVIIARDHHILAVLRESDRAAALVHAPASQVASRAAWLSSLAATAEEREIIDAIVTYRETSDRGVIGFAGPSASIPAAALARAQARAFSPGEQPRAR